MHPKSTILVLMLVAILSLFAWSGSIARTQNQELSRNGGPGVPADAGMTIFLPSLAQNSIHEMIYIPEGSFSMGCDWSHNINLPCYSEELPLHTVYLNSYFIDKYEVSNEEYARCVALGSCAAPAFKFSATRESYYDNPEYADYPVVYITWHNADDYCTWAGKRLPTEAEWENAARGTVLQTFPWGDSDPDCALANSYSEPNQMYCLGDTTLISSYAAGASPYGVLNMAGNVEEWVSDWFQFGYYNVSPPVDPTGPEDGIAKMIRGGDWYSGWRALRVAFRQPDDPSHRYSNVGFRCAASP